MDLRCLRTVSSEISSFSALVSAPYPRCKVMLVMGKSNPENPRHRQHSTILVPRDTPGITLVRELRVFDSLHSPAGEAELLFEDVRVPVTNMIKGEGRGFEIA